MTGKQLKEWAAAIHDDAVVQVREKGYRTWVEQFTMQAIYNQSWEWDAEKQPGPVEIAPSVVPMS